MRNSRQTIHATYRLTALTTPTPTGHDSGLNVIITASARLSERTPSGAAWGYSRAEPFASGLSNCIAENG